MRKIIIALCVLLCSTVTVSAQVPHDIINIDMYAPGFPTMASGLCFRFGNPNTLVDGIYPFRDTINRFDSEVLPGSMFPGSSGYVEGICIFSQSIKLTIETLPAPGMGSLSPFDTLQILTLNLGINTARTSYLLKFFSRDAFGHDLQYIKRVKLIDQYLGTSKEFVPRVSDTPQHAFSVSLSDPPGVGSRRVDRFVLVVSKIDGFVIPPPPPPMIGTVTTQVGDRVQAYPNPIERGTSLTIDLGASYDNVRLMLRAMNGENMLRSRFSGRITQLQIPSYFAPGMYILMITNGPKKTTTKKITVL